MKSHIQYWLLAALAGMIVFQSLFQRSRLQETLQTTQKMDQQLDSLWQIFQQYEQTLQNYEAAYEQLSHAQDQAGQIKLDLSRMSGEQQADVLDIYQQLRSLTSAQNDFRLQPFESIDSLRFQP